MNSFSEKKIKKKGKENRLILEWNKSKKKIHSKERWVFYDVEAQTF